MRPVFFLLLSACSPSSGPEGARGPGPGDGDSAGVGDTGTVAADAPWCADPAEALAYEDIGPAWGLVDTTDSNPKRMEAGPVASLDLDGDAVLAVGAARDDSGHDVEGAVYVLFLHANGTLKREQKIGSEDGGLVGPLDRNGDFGASLASLGRNADGDMVLAVGASEDECCGGPDADAG